MRCNSHVRLTIAAAVLLAALGATAVAQTNDPATMPNQNQRPNGGHNVVVPSLADMGSGTGEGNVGVFPTLTDKEFANLTAVRAMMEIELGSNAADKGSTPEVKALGQRMAKDYLEWSTGIRKASARLGIALPDGLDAKHKAEVSRILALSGRAFDHAYLIEMVRLQNEAITVTQHEASSAGISGFRHWSGVTVPIMQDQLELAKHTLAGTTESKK